MDLHFIKVTFICFEFFSPPLGIKSEDAPHPQTPKYSPSVYTENSGLKGLMCFQAS